MRRLNQNEEFKAKNRVIQAPWHGRHRIYGERSSSGSSLRLLLVGSRVHEPLMRCCSSLEIGLGMGHLPAYCWLNSPLRFSAQRSSDSDPFSRSTRPYSERHLPSHVKTARLKRARDAGRIGGTRPLPATSPTTVTGPSRYCSAVAPTNHHPINSRLPALQRQRALRLIIRSSGRFSVEETLDRRPPFPR